MTLPAVVLGAGVAEGVERRDGALCNQAGVRQQPTGRADEATLWLKDLGEKVFYGG